MPTKSAASDQANQETNAQCTQDTFGGVLADVVFCGIVYLTSARARVGPLLLGDLAKLGGFLGGAGLQSLGFFRSDITKLCCAFESLFFQSTCLASEILDFPLRRQPQIMRSLGYRWSRRETSLGVKAASIAWIRFAHDRDLKLMIFNAQCAMDRREWQGTVLQGACDFSRPTHSSPIGFPTVMNKFLAIILSLGSSLAAAATHPCYVGTRTDRDSKGIYLVDFDDATGSLSNLRLAASYKDPGFLCLHPKKKLLYSIGARPDGTGTLATFAIGKNLALSFLNDVPSGGKGPCHVAVDHQGKMVAVANYGDGSTASFLLDPKGIPSEAATVIKHQGKSVHPQRQTGPHAHGVYFSGEILWVPDLGLDQTLAYSFDSNTGKISPAREQSAFASSTPGDGPRHLAIHPNQPWVYVVNELSNTVTHFIRSGTSLTAQKSVSTLPSAFQGTNTTAEIEIHPNGRFLYASNRGHQSIAAFTIDQKTGALTEVGQTVTVVKTPRHFTIAPGGAYLIVAGQDSDNLQVLAIDPQSGKLTVTDSQIKVPSPICLLFAKP